MGIPAKLNAESGTNPKGIPSVIPKSNRESVAATGERRCALVSAMGIFGPLIPANYRAIDAAKVAPTLLARTPSAEGPGRRAIRR
jgi:hypothetical protein